MSKRPYVDAFDLRPPSNVANGPAIPGADGAPVSRRYSIHEERPERELSENASESAAAAAATASSRNFIAVQACETCRLKKTRCDEDRPCGFCRSLGVECRYVERRSTKKETSLSMIMSVLRRVESKLDRGPSDVIAGVKTELQAAIDNIAHRSPEINHVRLASIQGRSLPNTPGNVSLGHMTPREINDHESNQTESASSQLASGRVQISFSQHHTTFWPAINKTLPDHVRDLVPGSKPDWAVEMELKRSPLSMTIVPYPVEAGPGWLDALPLSLITGLSEAFFATFNPTTPIMDRDAYFANTLSVIYREGFGCNTESCIVLDILALGCLAVKAYEEGDYSLSGTRSYDNGSSRMGFEAPSWIEVIREDYPGLSFFNEARKRSGFLLCDNDLPSCQFYLLSGLYYSQIIRPTDSWAMVNRACICSLTLIKSGPPVSCDDWEGDMQCRLFWTSLMLESILIQELSLPTSGLQEYEGTIPIPRFTAFPHNTTPSSRPAMGQDDTFFQFHFLAQVAHRIILTRIRNTVFYYSETENFPPPPLVSELHHQLDQWRSSLPELIKSSSDDAGYSSARPKSPAHAVADAMLRARYKIANFHISRPFMYKALHRPESLSKYDLQECHDGLVSAMDWAQVMGINLTMMSCMPIKFALSSQFYGQLLLFRATELSPDPRVRQTLPTGYKAWCRDMMSFLTACAVSCPSLARDVAILKGLGY